MSKTRPTSLDRRRFIRGVAAGGTLVAGAAAAGVRLRGEPPVRAPQRERAAPQSRSNGYSETAHVRRYYDLARF